MRVIDNCLNIVKNTKIRFADMTKVYDATAGATVRLSRMSLAYTGLFVLKLASTPLFAYLTEPLPWSVPERTLTTWDSFDAFNNATFSYLASLYNSHTMPDATNVCRFDSATITFVARHVLELPVTSVPSTSSMTYLVQIPGAMFFSPGLLQFVSTFLSANATTRRTSRLSQCQRNYYFGVVSSDSCIWLDPLPVVESSSKDLYMAYYGTHVSLSAHHLHLTVLWRWYCSHYQSLLVGLREIGLGDQYSRYEVIVGDPTNLILSNPLVSLVMVVDIVLGPAYIAWSILRVCQFQDLLALFLGCFYSSRYVWCGYLAMRILSYAVHLRGWESKFTPIDPGVLGLGAFLYGGPVMTLFGSTSLMVLFHATWKLSFRPSHTLTRLKLLQVQNETHIAL
ncbi:hypothetical protein LEN26_013629 [Aphanomyces euteiches]|nr:hypothetical protein LEN26_013629 [Aphanomyces euteiches]KAH9115216.1 hypothetical protein AeMF1_010733 [Aphanomyces euteiches]KAH9191552.1 hypothetical protein AeNC1_006472 [Aphanomyces euteiches]